MKKIKIILKDYNQELVEINKELKNSPEGSLGKKKSYYYQITREKHIGITRNVPLTRQLCRKKYLQARKIQLENNISRPLSQFDFRTPSELIASLPKVYQDIPIDYFYHPSIAPWQAEIPERNTIAPENAQYTSNNGTQLRSMAEREIADQLESYGLPYHYDTIIYPGGKKVAPDFIIKNPFTRETFIWEHFGAFDQENYADSMNYKMDLYMNCGPVPSENLITTYQYHIRNPRRIQNLIEQTIL